MKYIWRYYLQFFKILNAFLFTPNMIKERSHLTVLDPVDHATITPQYKTMLLRVALQYRCRKMSINVTPYKRHSFPNQHIGCFLLARGGNKNHESVCRRIPLTKGR